MNTIMFGAGEYVLAAIAFLLLVAPLVHFLLAGWKSKRKEILDSFSNAAVMYYFRVFFPGHDPIKGKPRTYLENYYDLWFGRRHFTQAIVVLLAVSASMICFAAWACFLWLRPTEKPVLVIPAIAVAATAGAYAWVALDLITRDHQGDIHPNNVFHASYRLLVAVPLAIGITALFTEQIGVPVAILLGAFPTQTLMTIVRRVVAKRLELGGTLEGASDLERLQGVGRNEADRFKEEGVSTILQLAYADPVALTMKTSFAFSYVVDCCSQALAWPYFEDDLAKMRRLGLRGAQEIRGFVEDLKDLKHPTRAERAHECVKELARALLIDINVLEWKLEAIAYDPYSKFLWEIWCTEPRTTKKVTAHVHPSGNRGTGESGDGIGGHHESAGQSRQRVADERAAQERNSELS
jgi:hypothetical protein